MRPPSLNLRSRFRTFHSISLGGRLLGLLKKISYSIFSRRKCESSRFSSSSMVTRKSPPQAVYGFSARGTRFLLATWRMNESTQRSALVHSRSRNPRCRNFRKEIKNHRHRSSARGSCHFLHHGE